MSTCMIEGCTRHEFDHLLCLEHLREVVAYRAQVAQEGRKEARKGTSKRPAARKRTKRPRAKVDAVEVHTTDAPVETEERSDTE